MRTSIAVLVIMLYALCSYGTVQKGRIISKVDIDKLHLSSVTKEGGGTYSVIGRNDVVLAKGKELLIIRNNEIKQKMQCPTLISTFDINEHGNGAIVSDNVIYKVVSFRIQPQPIKVTLPNTSRGVFIFGIDVIDNFALRITLSEPNVKLITNLNDMAFNKYEVLKEDEIESFISSEKRTEYVGRDQNTYYFVNSTARDGIERVIALDKGSISRIIVTPPEQRHKLENTLGKTCELGDLGRRIPMSNPVRINENAGTFYLMLVEKNNLVVMEFNIKECF